MHAAVDHPVVGAVDRPCIRHALNACLTMQVYGMFCRA